MEPHAASAKGLIARPPKLRSGAGGAAPQDGVQLGLGLVLPKDYVPAAESAHALYQVELASFSGPLDLLLFLIKRHHLNIFDIPMAFICARYVETLEAMQSYTLDVAAEFMFMASELLHIKSRMLLPQIEDKADGDEDEGDPRAELVARLLAYQTFKEAADTLQVLPQTGRDVFGGRREDIEPGPPKLRELDAMALVRAFDQVLSRQKPEVRHQVIVEQVPMRLRMHRIIALLDARRAASAGAEAVAPEGASAGAAAQDVAEALPQAELVPAGATLAFADVLAEVEARVDLIVSFLAVLEMAKLKLLRIYISDHDALWLRARFGSSQEATERLAGANALDYAG